MLVQSGAVPLEVRPDGARCYHVGHESADPQHGTKCYCGRPATRHIYYGTGCGNACGIHARKILGRKHLKPEPPNLVKIASGGGRILVRLPATLHEVLTARAAAEGVSLNHLVVALLASGVGFTLDDHAALAIVPVPDHNPDEAAREVPEAASHEHEYTGPDDVCHVCGADRPTETVVELPPDIGRWLGFWLARLPRSFEEVNRGQALSAEDERCWRVAAQAFEDAGIEVKIGA